MTKLISHSLPSAVLKVLFTLFGCLFVFGAHANVEPSMNRMFNAMINVTPGGYYETQAAGVLTGGGFVYRPQVSRLQLVTIDPPRLRAGCNGIDAYTGSLSFLSKEQFINFLRNLASALPAYAFNMALSFLCKDCDQHLARLQKLAQDVNALTLNTCKMDMGEFAQKARTIGKDMDELAKSKNELASHWSGLVGDPHYARQQWDNATGKLYDAAKGGNAEANKYLKETDINIFWAATNKSALSTWWGVVLGAADTRLYNEVMMSFTGTIVTTHVPTEEDPAKKEPRTKVLFPILKFRDFLQGGTVKIYKCPPPVGSDPDDCLIFPDETNIASTRQDYIMPSFRQKVRDMLFVSSAGVPGVIARISARRSVDASLEITDPGMKAFVSAMPGAIYANLRDLAAVPNAANTYGDAISEWLAAEMTYQYLAEQLRNARIAANDVNAPAQQTEWIRQLGELEKEMREVRSLYADNMVALRDALQIGKHIRDNLVSAQAGALRPGAFAPQN